MHILVVDPQPLHCHAPRAVHILLQCPRKLAITVVACVVLKNRSTLKLNIAHTPLCRTRVMQCNSCIFTHHLRLSSGWGLGAWFLSGFSMPLAISCQFSWHSIGVRALLMFWCFESFANPFFIMYRYSHSLAWDGKSLAFIYAKIISNVSHTFWHSLLSASIFITSAKPQERVLSHLPFCIFCFSSAHALYLFTILARQLFELRI